MSKETICLAYTGVAVDGGKMDVNSLAPALLAFGDLVSECNSILNADSSKVSVYVKSDFKTGSFEINLELVRSLSDQIKLMFVEGQEYSIKEILEMLGLFASLTGVSVWNIISFIKGRKIKRATQIDKDTYRLYVDSVSDEYIDVSGDTLKIFRSLKVRKSIESMVSPLKMQGIDGFEVRDKQDNTTTLRVDESEVEYYDQPDVEEEPLTNETMSRHFVRVSSVNFEKNLKWRFDNGEIKFYANIVDEEFIAMVAEGKVSFAKGVALDADIRMLQSISGGEIKTDYTIVKVHKVIGKPEQLDLNFDE